MRILFFALIFLISPAGYSQKVIDVGKGNLPTTANLFYTVGGEPVSNAKYIRVVEGSPFFDETWVRGKITLSQGATYDSIMLRLDLVDNTVHYMTPGEEELIATTPIKSIAFDNLTEGKKYQFDYSGFMQATGKIEPGWYQLLDTGLVKLYKRHIKSITENKPYGSATYEQKITTSGLYYILINSVLTPVKKFKKLPDLLQDKKTELTAYANIKNLSGKSDADYIALISYYNSLFVR